MARAGNDFVEEDLSRSIRWCNSRSEIRRRSRAIRSCLRPEMMRLPGDACVSAIFVDTTSKATFLSDHDDVLGFEIGGLVREKSRFFHFTAQRIFSTRSLDVLTEKFGANIVRVGFTSPSRRQFVEGMIWRKQGSYL